MEHMEQDLKGDFSEISGRDVYCNREDVVAILQGLKPIAMIFPSTINDIS